MSPIVFSIIVFAVCSVTSFIIFMMCVTSLYKHIHTEELAMSYYRKLTTRSFMQKFMRFSFVLLVIFFGVYIFRKFGNMDDELKKMMLGAEAAFIVLTIDVYALSGIGEGLAKARLITWVTETFDIPDAYVAEWTVETDEDDYPEEIEVDLITASVPRTFLIDLERHIVREKRINERID